jgi:hypothetical protein
VTILLQRDAPFNPLYRLINKTLAKLGINYTVWVLMENMQGTSMRPNIRKVVLIFLFCDGNMFFFASSHIIVIFSVTILAIVFLIIKLDIVV